MMINCFAIKINLFRQRLSVTNFFRRIYCYNILPVCVIAVFLQLPGAERWSGKSSLLILLSLPAEIKFSF